MIVLPQTALRVWGMNLGPTLFFQEEYIKKYPRDSEIEVDIYEMNKLLLEHDGHQVSRVYERAEEIPFSKNLEILLDCQSVNLLHHYSNLQNLTCFSIIDYSSLGHRYVSFRDFIPINHFVRAIARCIKFKHKYDVKQFWNWRMPWEKKGWPISEILWGNNFLNHALLTSKCKSFLRRNLHFFPEFSNLHLDTRVLLICPHTDHEFTQFLQELSQLLAKDSEALQFYGSAERIFVKQHRIAPHIFPSKFELHGRTVELIENSLSRNLPSEILILGMDNLALFSSISSVIFAAQGHLVKTFGNISMRDRRDYGLMLHRAKRDWTNLDLFCV